MAHDLFGKPVSTFPDHALSELYRGEADDDKRRAPAAGASSLLRGNLAREVQIVVVIRHRRGHGLGGAADVIRAEQALAHIDRRDDLGELLPGVDQRIAF